MKDTSDLPVEAELVRRAQAGDTNAFAELVTTHQQFVYNLAFHSLGDAREAEDVAQEALIRAWKGLPRFRHQSRFRTWLYRIVTNLCFTRLPRVKRDLELLNSDQDESMTWGTTPDPAAGIEAVEQQAFLHREIEALPESYRIVLLLRFKQDMAYEEIADVLGMPLGTVKIALFRARQRLRTALQEYEDRR